MLWKSEVLVYTDKEYLERKIECEDIFLAYLHKHSAIPDLTNPLKPFQTKQQFLFSYATEGCILGSPAAMSQKPWPQLLCT